MQGARMGRVFRLLQSRAYRIPLLTAGFTLPVLALAMRPSPVYAAPSAPASPAAPKAAAPATEQAIFPDASPAVQRMERLARAAQQEVIQQAESFESNTKFQSHDNTPEASTKRSGRSMPRIIQDGDVFEKGGVNTSFFRTMVTRDRFERMVDEHTEPRQRELLQKAYKHFEETGTLPLHTSSISLILHPRNPHCPTVHANFRYFELSLLDGTSYWWFGGGTDLTPAIVNLDDGKHFHSTIKSVCDKHDKAYYPKFKAWADRYFVNQHRREARGIGGIFFDNLNDRPQEEVLSFIQDCLQAFPTAYFPLVKKHMNDSFDEPTKEWQLVRRGRYVEFNLVYDKGTKHGLMQPGVNPEAVLVSLPLNTRFLSFSPEPAPGSPMANSIAIFRKPIEWV